MDPPQQPLPSKAAWGEPPPLEQTGPASSLAGSSSSSYFQPHQRSISTSSVASAGSGGSGGSGGAGGNNKKLRRSCDRCTSKKIRCDGLAACDNCARRGYACHYSARKRTGPKIKHAVEEHPEWRNHATHNGLIPWLQMPGATPQPPQPPQPQAQAQVQQVQAAQLPQPPQSQSAPGASMGAPETVSSPHVVGAAYVYPALPLQPPQHNPPAPPAPPTVASYLAAAPMPPPPAPQPPGGLSGTMPVSVSVPAAYLDPAAQPQGPGAVAVAANAGPLVGRSEEEYMEAFLAEFNSYMPMVDEGWLRGELKRFAAGAPLPMSSVAAMNWSLCAETAAARVRDVQLANAHNATLWGALAVGAMLCGGSPQEVCKYSRLAWVSMRECFDLNEPATVSAYLCVAIVSMMHGQMDRYRRYLFMAEGISRELGATLSAEVETVLRYLAVGHAPDVRLLERQWQDISTMDMPSDDPYLQMLHRLTRAKIYLIFNRHQSEWNQRQGLPRSPIDFDMVVPEFEAALAIIKEGRAAGSSAGVIFIRGMLGVLKYVREGGAKPAEALEVMKPIINHLIRCPGVLRLQPSYHMLHSIAMLLQATGDLSTYEAVQRRFSATQWSDCATLPPLGTPLDGLCDHPICQAMGNMSFEARRRVYNAQGQEGQAEDGAAQQDRPNLKRDRSAGADAEQEAAKMESEMTGLSMEDLQELGNIFGQSDFPAYEVF